MGRKREYLEPGLDEKTVWKRVMVRPAMYGGRHQLHDIHTWVDGYRFGSDPMGSLPRWDQNYELGLWLFQTQGVVLHTTCLNIWSLFYRTFGVSSAAIGKLAEMLHTNIPPSPYAAASDDPFGIHDLAGEVGQIRESLDPYDDDGPTLAPEDINREIYETLSDMIAQQRSDYDEVRVYIWKESPYTQLRCVYHTPDGWMDDGAIIANPEHHARLARLHALIHLCPYDDLRYHCNADDRPAFYTHIYGKDGLEWDFFEMERKIKNKETLWRRYEKWRIRFTASY